MKRRWKGALIGLCLSLFLIFCMAIVLIISRGGVSSYMDRYEEVSGCRLEGCIGPRLFALTLFISEFVLISLIIILVFFFSGYGIGRLVEKIQRGP